MIGLPYVGLPMIMRELLLQSLLPVTTGSALLEYCCAQLQDDQPSMEGSTLEDETLMDGGEFLEESPIDGRVPMSKLAERRSGLHRLRERAVRAR